MPQRRLADQALEIKDLIGQLDRVAMQQVDFQLPGAAFLGDAVDLEALGFGEIIDVVDDGSEFIHGGHGIGLPRGGGAARAAHHRLDLLGRVQIARDQIEFHLGRDNRFPALLVIEVHHPLEDVARRIGDRVALAVIGVMDHLQRPVPGPGRGGGRGHVGAQDHVALDEPLGPRRLAPVAGDGLVEDRIRQMEIILPRELAGGHGLAPRDAGQVRYDAFHLVQAAVFKEKARSLGQAVGPVVHLMRSF